MVVGLLGNESSDSNRLTLVTPKSENDVRLQATLDNQNPTGLPVGVVSVIVLSMCIYVKNILEMIQKLYHWITTESEENHYDIVKMTFIWTIIAFIIGKIW